MNDGRYTKTQLVSLDEVFTQLPSALEKIIPDQSELQSVCAAVREVLIAIFPNGGITDYDEFLSAPKAFFSKTNGHCKANPRTESVAAPHLPPDYIPKHLLRVRALINATADLIRSTLRQKAGTNLPFIGPEIPLRLIDGSESIGIAELHDYCRRLREGDRPEAARRRLIMAFRKLAQKIARGYKSKGAKEGVDVSGLEDEAIEGILSGAKKFEPERNIKLATFISWWIKSSVRRAFEKRRKLTGVTEHRTQKISDQRKTADAFFQQRGRQPTRAELAKLLAVDTDHLDQNDRAKQPVLSFETPNRDNSRTLGDSISTSIGCESAIDEFDMLRLIQIGKGMATLLDAEERRLLHLVIDRNISVCELHRTVYREECSRETLNQRYHRILLKLRAFANGAKPSRILQIKVDDIRSMEAAEAALYQ